MSESNGDADVMRPAARPLWLYILIAAGITMIAGLIEWQLGRLPISKTGEIRLWTGAANGAETSQQIADWYSLSHIIHGIAFYGLLRWIGKGKWPIGVCFAAAILIEAAWEVFENTPFTIDRYRQGTIATLYYGDSILNSMCDILFCAIGFLIAAKLRVWMTAALVVILELIPLLIIRDNLTLNIVMFLRPFEAIRRWQEK